MCYFHSNMFIFPLELLGCGCVFFVILQNILFFYFNLSLQAGGVSWAIGKDIK